MRAKRLIRKGTVPDRPSGEQPTTDGFDTADWVLLNSTGNGGAWGGCIIFLALAVVAVRSLGYRIPSGRNWLQRRKK